MSSINVKTKLLSSFAVVSIITAVLGLFANSIIHRIDDNDTRLYEENTVAIACLAKIYSNLQLLQERVNFVVNKNDPPTAEEIKKILAFESDSETHFLMYKKLLKSDSQKNLFAEFMKHVQTFLDITEKSLSLAANSNQEKQKNW